MFPGVTNNTSLSGSQCNHKVVFSAVPSGNSHCSGQPVGQYVLFPSNWKLPGNRWHDCSLHISLEVVVTWSTQAMARSQKQLFANTVIAWTSIFFPPTATLCGQQKNLCAVLENTNHYSSCVPSPCLAQCHTSRLQTTSSLWYTAHSLWSCCSISIYYPNTSSGFTCFSFFLVSAEGGLMWLETLNSSKEKLQSHKKSIVPSE